MRFDNLMVDFIININKLEIIEILSFLVEILFDIDNLFFIKVYFKLFIGLFIYVLYEEWFECIEFIFDCCDLSLSFVIDFFY